MHNYSGITNRNLDVAIA